MSSSLTSEQQSASGRIAEVFMVFLRLGLTSFGGPIAHLGYFREELVVRRKWLSEVAYADLVALCQFLPGPASSQVGFALGLLRAGPWGAFAAWLMFTLPSALVLLVFAYGATAFSGPVDEGFLHGLKLVAVAVVAHAVWGMARSLCPDKTRAAIGLSAVFIVVFAASAIGQIAAILAGAVAGWLWCRADDAVAPAQFKFPVSTVFGAGALVLFFVLLIGLPFLVLVFPAQSLALFEAFYRSGALVFGGGHVVLPLLEASVVAPGWVSEESFVAGYGAAQAVPGPLFTFATFLGASTAPGFAGTIAAGLATVAIFLPGFLLVVGVLPFWDHLRAYQSMQAVMRGTNAAVVGILAAALYDPVWTSAIVQPTDFAVALGGFLLLTVWRRPAWQVVIVLALAGVGLSWLSF